MQIHRALGPRTLFVIAITSLPMLAAPAAADCLPIEEAPRQIGKMACVTGRVVNVGKSRGAHYLNFCEDYRKCPFTVVVFNRDLKDEDKLEAFNGQTIRIYGPVQDYKGHAEIVLKLEEQLSGEPGPYADKLAEHPHNKDPKPKVPSSASRDHERGWRHRARW